MSASVSYAAGDTAGRDHIQWPTILRSEIPDRAGTDPSLYDETWPVDINLVQAMALAWRVKEWRFSGTCNVTLVYDFGLDHSEISGDIDVPDSSLFNLLDGVKCTRERDLVGRLFPVSPYSPLVNDGTGGEDGALPIANWTTTNPTNDLGGNFSGSGNLDPRFWGFFALFDPDTGLFSPNFSGPNALIPFGVTSNQLLVSAVFKRDPSELLAVTGPALLKAPGTMTVIPGIAPSFDVPMEIQWRLIGEDTGSIITGTGECDFTLEAVSFWPYEDSQHLPVWDSATGAQLRNPFG